MRPSKKAARSLSLACREAASDEQVAEWLLAIAAGRDPWARKRADGDAVFSIPPDWTHRLAAFKMFLERRDGAPMQAVVLKAELEHVLRAEGDRGVIDVDALGDAEAEILRAALRRQLSAVDALQEPEDALQEHEQP